MTEHKGHSHTTDYEDMDNSAKYKIRNLNSIERRKWIGKITKKALIVIAIIMVIAAMAVSFID